MMKMVEKQTRFEIKYHHRHELREWIRTNFGWVEKRHDDNKVYDLESRAVEILDACQQVEQIDIRNRSNYVDYYANDWKRIRHAVVEKDYKRLAEDLADLLTGIDWE